jgi:type IV secretory pathway VirD2 relaxase
LLGERNDIIKTMHRALNDHGPAEERGPGQYAFHGTNLAALVVGRVLAKGLADDERGERLYPVVDGVHGQVHHVEFPDASRVEDVHRGMTRRSRTTRLRTEGIGSQHRDCCGR